MAVIVNLSLCSFPFAIIFLSSLFLIDAQNAGFSVGLIHRDSSNSPYYNPFETTHDRVTNALHRSFSRVNLFKPNTISNEEVEATIIANSGDYLMKLSIGTPAFDIVAVADTTSDLIWTQCKPCSLGYQQDAPLFDPSHSSTYEIVSCSVSQCQNYYGSSCSVNNTCIYSVSYGVGFTKGDVAADTLTLLSTDGQPVAIPKIIFGCGHNNSFTYLDEKSSGIIGLAGGNVSLISQLNDTIAGKFSYCLLPLDKEGESSKMNFGSNAIVSGNEVVSTPLYKKNPYTSYFLNLEGVSVGSTRINFTGSSAFGAGNGNIVIDSGTALTLVPDDFYSQLESAVSSQIKASRLEGEHLLCYKETGSAFPDITVHFTDADVKLQPLNAFALFANGISCFTFSSNNANLAIYGNLVQMNFLVGYDTQKQTVSFLPTDCSSSEHSVSTSSASPNPFLIAMIYVKVFLSWYLATK